MKNIVSHLYHLRIKSRMSVQFQPVLGLILRRRNASLSLDSVEFNQKSKISFPVLLASIPNEIRPDHSGDNTALNTRDLYLF